MLSPGNIHRFNAAGLTALLQAQQPRRKSIEDFEIDYCVCIYIYIYSISTSILPFSLPICVCALYITLYYTAWKKQFNITKHNITLHTRIENDKTIK